MATPDFLTDAQIEALPDCRHCFHSADEHAHMKRFGDRYMSGWHKCDHPECDESEHPCTGYEPMPESWK